MKKKRKLYLIVGGLTCLTGCQFPANNRNNHNTQPEIAVQHDYACSRALFLNQEGKYGYLDARGEVVIEAQYDRAYDFSEGLALVGNTDKEGTTTYRLINAEGNVVRTIPSNNWLLSDRVVNGKLEYRSLDTGEQGELTVISPHAEENVSSSHTEEKNVSSLTTEKNAVSSHAEENVIISSRPKEGKKGKNRTVTLSTPGTALLSSSPFYAEAKKVAEGRLEVEDAQHRQLILNYCEHFRTAYTSKDIDFLQQIFSDRALIVVGTVVKSAPSQENNFLRPEQVIYNIKSKREYLQRLKQVFDANKKIDVKFSNFRILRHPTHPAIYGVSLRQGYRSDIYSDDGYLFLLWDFTDETAPKIHVRTWQPTMLNDETLLPKEEILGMGDFNLK